MESDDEIEETIKWEGSPGTIILINALEDSNTIDIAHDATCLLIRQYLRLSSSHNVGVCFYGTDQTNTDLNSNNVVDVIPLDAPTLEGYKKLRAVDIESFGKAKEYVLSEVLWHCSKIFKNFKKKLSSQTVIILTKLLNPPIKTDQRRTLDRVLNLIGSYTKITFINISSDDYPIDKFYKELLIDIYKSQEYALPKAVWDSNVIQNMMYQHSHRHLAVAKLCFEIGPSFSIGVGVYSLLRKSTQSYHKTSNIDSTTNEPVTRVTMRTKVTVGPRDSQQDSDISEESKELPLLDSELLFCQEYGGERIEFTKKEKEAMSNPFGPPMLKLLGFKPAIKLCKEKWFLKTGYFLYPNESVIEGSTVAFKALHKACDEMKTVAICMLCTRANSRPNIVALAPCSRPLDLEIEIGFDVIHIPFAENVRHIPHLEDEFEKPANESKQKDEMKNILQSLLFDYKADMFENPKLQSQYRAIEAKALQETSTFLEPFIDTTIQDPKKYQTIREDIFEELFGPFGVLSIKRTGNADASNKTKKVKTEDIDEAMIQEMVLNKTLKNLTVTQLKSILKDRNISISKNMNKSDLCDLVYENCASS